MLFNFLKPKKTLKEVLSKELDLDWNEIKPITQVGMAMLALIYISNANGEEMTNTKLFDALTDNDIDFNADSLISAQGIIDRSNLVTDYVINFENPDNILEWVLVSQVFEGLLECEYRDGKGYFSSTPEGDKIAKKLLSSL